MARRKLEHYRFSGQADNVIEAGKPLYSRIRGRWRELYFGNEGELVVELACGKGEYSVGLGKLFPKKNFIGIDIKGDRIARGSMMATELDLKNVAFLRAGIQYADEFFAAGELDEIWLVHPDPQVRDRDEKKRLTNPTFLSKYAAYLRPDGYFCLKTDSTFLYEYSLMTIASSKEFEVLDHTDNLYNSHLLADHHHVETHYEGIFRSRGHAIKYIKSVRI
jgi:tRNA (guanine-N7-)-methyltransferase